MIFKTLSINISGYDGFPHPYTHPWIVHVSMPALQQWSTHSHMDGGGGMGGCKGDEERNESHVNYWNTDALYRWTLSTLLQHVPTAHTQLYIAFLHVLYCLAVTPCSLLPPPPPPPPQAAQAGLRYAVLQFLHVYACCKCRRVVIVYQACRK